MQTQDFLFAPRPQRLNYHDVSSAPLFDPLKETAPLRCYKARNPFDFNLCSQLPFHQKEKRTAPAALTLIASFAHLPMQLLIHHKLKIPASSSASAKLHTRFPNDTSPTGILLERQAAVHNNGISSDLSAPRFELHFLKRSKSA